MYQVGFIGAGRMAGAIVSGLLKNEVYGPAEIACSCGDDETGPALAEKTGIAYVDKIETLALEADTLLLACKPQQLASLPEALNEWTGGKLVISILAGKKLASLSGVFPKARNVVRAMPNTPGQIGEGITAFCSLDNLDDADLKKVSVLLGSLGRFLELPEEQMDAVTAVSGSGPAYVFEFATAFCEAGKKAGLSHKVAETLVYQTLMGAVKLLHASGETPEGLRDRVTSPGGTTAEGLKVMEAGEFRQLMADVVDAAKKRSEALSA